MEEIFELCDRITVLRDGEYVGTENIAEIDLDHVVQMMIGRTIGERFPKRESHIGEEVLRVEGLTSGKLFKDVHFDVKAGVYGQKPQPKQKTAARKRDGLCRYTLYSWFSSSGLLTKWYTIAKVIKNPTASATISAIGSNCTWR